MNRKLIFILLFFAMFFDFQLSAQTSKEPLMSENINNIVIDGNDSDWYKATIYFDEKTGILYSIANDKNNLYIMLKLTDNQTAMKVARAGLELWLSPDGRDKSSSGIKYPIPMSFSDMRAMRNREDGSRETTKNIMKKAFSIMELRGFINIKNDTYEIDKTPIKVEYSTENGDGIIEYKIPFETFCNKNEINSENVFAFGINVNGIQMNFSRGGTSVMFQPLNRDMRKMAETKTTWIYAKMLLK